MRYHVLDVALEVFKLTPEILDQVHDSQFLLLLFAWRNFEGVFRAHLEGTLDFEFKAFPLPHGQTEGLFLFLVLFVVVHDGGEVLEVNGDDDVFEEILIDYDEAEQVGHAHVAICALAQKE